MKVDLLLLLLCIAGVSSVGVLFNYILVVPRIILYIIGVFIGVYIGYPIIENIKELNK